MSRPVQLAKRFRAHATRLWDSTCTIRRKTGETYDPATATTTPTYTTVYTGACQVRPQSLQEREVLFADRAVSVTSFVVEVPHTATVERGDEVTVDSSPDPLAAGADLVVRDVPLDDWVVVRKLVGEKVS